MNQINHVKNFFGRFLDLVFIDDDLIFSLEAVEFPLAINDLHQTPISILLEVYDFLPANVSPNTAYFKFVNADFHSVNSLLLSWCFVIALLMLCTTCFFLLSMMLLKILFRSATVGIIMILHGLIDR